MATKRGSSEKVEKAKRSESVKDKKEEYIKIDFFGKIKNMFFNPSKFFKNIEGEKFQVSLKLYLSFFIAYMLVSIIIGLSQGIITIYLGLANLIYSVILALIIAGLLSYITFLIGKLFGSKKNFIHSFKPVAYTLVIWIVYSFISMIFYYLVPFDNSMLQVLQVSLDSTVVKEAFLNFLKQPGAIINNLILIISLTHIVIFNSKGIEKFQEISKGKSYAVVILSWFVLLVVIISIMFLMILASSS